MPLPFKFYGHFNHPKYGTKHAQFKLPLLCENMRSVQQHNNDQGLTLSDELSKVIQSLKFKKGFIEDGFHVEISK